MKIVEQFSQDLRLLRRAMAFGLLAKKHQEIDCVGRVLEVATVLTRERVGGIAQRDHRGAGQHHEEPDEAALGLPARAGNGLGNGLRGLLPPGSRRPGLVIRHLSAAVTDLEGLAGLFRTHRGEPSIRENPCCIIA
jgi:hypothetical protein